MRFKSALILYRLLLPPLLIIAFPGWLMKMLRRGGCGTDLAERAALYTTPLDFEPCGVTHIHAVSVGETLLALKLIRQWHLAESNRPFVIATGTATGHAIATTAKIPNVRVTYAPLDFPSMVRRYLARFEPAQIILIEGETWPHLLLSCHQQKIPVRLVNARMSPRSARRYQKFANWLRPLFGLLDAVAVQDTGDASIWQTLGVPHHRIHQTGSLKFDPSSGTHPTPRPEFQSILDQLGNHRPIILAASTHPGEESWIATAIRNAAPHALPVIVPRHAERRADVKAELELAGFETILRSSFTLPKDLTKACLIIDSTGELSDWTAHASIVIIGKSFLSTGGQNPCEAILAKKPIILGPHMENFQPLANQLIANHACLVANTATELSHAITNALNPNTAKTMTHQALTILSHHNGATQRIIDLLNLPK
jgi:3-deoxy-D-manno-octulosonic-acid transferase